MRLLASPERMSPVDMPKLVARSGVTNAHALFLWMAFSCGLGFFLMNADRGFEITDEGLALVAASHPEDVRVAPSAFAYSTSILYRLAGADPGWFRRLGALSLVASAAALAWGLSRLLPGASLASLLPAAGLGALVFMSPGITMPSYNLIAACGLLCGMGFFLASGAQSEIRRARFLAVLSGAGLALGGLAKPPGAVTVSFLLLFVALGGLIRIPIPYWFLGGGLMVSQQLLRQGGGEFLQMIVDGLTFNRLVGEDYGPGALASQYTAQGFALAVLALKIATPALLAGLAAKTFARRLQASAPLWMSGILLGTLVAVGAFTGGHRQATSGQSAAALLASLLVCAMGAWLARGPERASPGSRGRLLALLLTVTPLLSLFGTNTPVGFSALFFCAPWFLVPAALETASSSSTRGISALMSLLAASWIVSGPFVAPYRRFTPMGEQTIPVQVGTTGARLRVDPTTARFVRSYRAAAATCGLRAGDPVLAFSWTPGLVWAVGGRTFAITHFVHDFFPGARGANEFALSRVPVDVQERAFVIHTTRGARVHPVLLLGRRRFPADYRLCYEGRWPTNDDVVRLYAPPRNP